MSKWGKGFLPLCLFVISVACGGSSSSSSSSVDATASTVVPDGVVISSPTSSTSGDASISRFAVTRRLVGDAEGEDYDSKAEALQDLISGDAECAFTLNLDTPTAPTCYGPRVDYQNHPGGGNGQLPSYDVGIWAEETSDGEACAAAQINYLINNVSSRVDNAINLLGATACAGTRGGITLPEIGDGPLDLSSTLTEHLSVSGLTVSTATLERLDDTSDGDAQYRTTLNVSMTIDSEEHDVEITLTHVPEDADNTTYHGQLSMKFSDEDDSDMNCGATGTTGLTYAAVIDYDKSSASQVDYQMNYARFCGVDADPFDSNFEIDPSDKASGDNTDGWGGDWNYGRFSINSETGSQSVMYAWQAGANDGATRILNAEVSDDGDGSFSGDAWYGFGNDIEDGDNGVIQGMVCNWAGPGQNRGVGNYATQGPLELVQYQGLEKASGDTAYSSVTADLAITYAPTNSCDYAGGTFTYQSSEAQTGTSLDNLTGALVTNDLKDLSEYQSSFTLLTDLGDGI